MNQDNRIGFVIFAFLLSVCFAQAAYLQQDSVTDAVVAGAGVYVGSGAGNNEAGFLWTAGATYDLTQVEVQLNKAGSPTGNVFCRVYSVAAGSPGTLLGTSTNQIATTSILTTIARYNFTFSSIAINSGTQYYITCSKTVYDTEVFLGSDSSGGTRTIKYYSGATWSSWTTSGKIWFITYSGTATNIQLRNEYNGTLIQSFSANITNSSASWINYTSTGGIVVEKNNLVNITYFNISRNTYFNKTYVNVNTSQDFTGNTSLAYVRLTAVDGLGTVLHTFSCQTPYKIYSTSLYVLNNVSLLGDMNLSTLTCSASGYSDVTKTFTVANLSSIQDSVLFGSSTIYFTIRYETDNSLANDTFVYIDLASDSNNYSTNYTTNNGSITATSLPNGYFNIIYYTNTSNKRSIYTYMPPAPSVFNYTLYVLPSTDSKTVALIVQDQGGERVENATILIFKWFVSGGYTQTGSYVTNYNGIVAADLDDFSLYKFLIYYNGEGKLSASEFFIYTVFGTTKTFTIQISKDTIGSLIDTSAVQFNITFDNTTSSWTHSWMDARNVITGACIYYLYPINNTPISSTCYAGASGTYTVLETHRGYLAAYGYVNTSDGLRFILAEFADISDAVYDNSILFITAIIMLAMFSMFIAVDWRIALILSVSFVLYIMQRIRLLPVPGYVVPTVTIIIIIIMVVSHLKGGRE